MPRKKNPVNPAPVNPTPPAPELIAANTLANEASGLLNRLQTALGDLVGTVSHPFREAKDDDEQPRRRNPHENGDEAREKPRLQIAADEHESEWVNDSCPVCKTDLIVAANVLRVSCPSCGTVLDLGDDETEDDADDLADGADESDEPAAKRGDRRKNPGLLGAFMRRKG